MHDTLMKANQYDNKQGLEHVWDRHINQYIRAYMLYLVSYTIFTGKSSYNVDVIYLH